MEDELIAKIVAYIEQKIVSPNIKFFIYCCALLLFFCIPVVWSFYTKNKELEAQMLVIKVEKEEQLTLNKKTQLILKYDAFIADLKNVRTLSFNTKNELSQILSVEYGVRDLNFILNDINLDRSDLLKKEIEKWSVLNEDDLTTKRLDYTVNVLRLNDLNDSDKKSYYSFSDFIKSIHNSLKFLEFKYSAIQPIIMRGRSCLNNHKEWVVKYKDEDIREAKKINQNISVIMKQMNQTDEPVYDVRKFDCKNYYAVKLKSEYHYFDMALAIAVSQVDSILKYSSSVERITDEILSNK